MLKFLFYLLFLIPYCFFNGWMIYIYCLFIFLLIFFFCWFNFFNIFFLFSYDFCLDNISFAFCCLSIWICLLVMIVMINYYFFCFFHFYFFLLMNFLLIFLFFDFIVYDFFYFYFFFECSIIPVFLILFGWGYQPERLFAGYFLVFYTLFGSFPFLLSIFFMYSIYGGFSYFFSDFLVNNFLMFFLSFSFFIKFPLFGLHLWLPKAHVEAPVSGSMILAGVMLKLGGYGLIRCLSFLYNFFFFYGYFIVGLCLIGCIFTSLFCLIQSDLKMLIAYSSVCHMGLVICGLVSMTNFGFIGSFSYMLAHGFVSSGLFFLVGTLYDRLGSRSFFILSGLISYCPSISFFWFLFCIFNMSCPPSLNLFSEFCLVISMLSWSFLTFFFFLFILFFSVCYSIMIFSFTQHGLFSGNLVFFNICVVREYYVLILHLIPVIFLMFNLFLFFLLI